jgi:hypothetical protein
MGLTQSCMEYFERAKQAPYRHRVLVVGFNLNRLNDAFLQRFCVDYTREGVSDYLTDTDYVLRCPVKTSTNRKETVDTIKGKCSLSWDEIYVYGNSERLYGWMIEEWPTSTVYSIFPGSEYGLLNPSSLKNSLVR